MVGWCVRVYRLSDGTIIVRVVCEKRIIILRASVARTDETVQKMSKPGRIRPMLFQHSIREAELRSHFGAEL